MATKTSLLGLTKPAYTEAADIAVLNNNFDMIDKAVGNSAHARNELDNSDFSAARFITQAGLNGTHGTVRYLGDRWLGHTSITATQQTDGVLLSSAATAAYVHQKVSVKVGQEYTVVFHATVATGGHRIAVYNGGISTLVAQDQASDRDLLLVKFTATQDVMAMLYYPGWATGGGSAVLHWAALYEGTYTAETLPTYVYKGYAVELAECMRYYQVFGEKRLVQSTQPNGGFSISERFAIPMRVAPTITGTYVAWSTVASGNTVVEQTAALATSESRADGFRGYYTVGIATELMMLDYAFAASADL